MCQASSSLLLQVCCRHEVVTVCGNLFCGNTEPFLTVRCCVQAQVHREAIQSTEQDGIVFLDEIDKIVTSQDKSYGAHPVSSTRRRPPMDHLPMCRSCGTCGGTQSVACVTPLCRAMCPSPLQLDSSQHTNT